jgi:hypothetical protein
MGLAGLIAGALGGAAKGYTEVAETNFKKSAELDLKKQLMEAEADKKLAIDAITRQRDISDIGGRTQATAEANLAAAPVNAQTELAKGEAAARNRTTLAPLTAEAAMAEYKAGKPLKDIQTTDAIKAEIEKTTTLAGDKDYIAGETALSKAKGAATIEAQRLRNEGAVSRAAGGTAAKAARVQKTITGENGNVIAIMSDGTPKDLGIKSGDYNKQISNLVTKMSKDDYKFAKLPEADKRKQAEERLRGQISTQLGESKRKPIESFDLND